MVDPHISMKKSQKNKKERKKNKCRAFTMGHKNVLQKFISVRGQPPS